MNRFIFLRMVLRADGTVTTNSGTHAFISCISFTWKYMLCR